MEVSSTIALGDPYIWGNDCEDALDDLDGTSGNRNPSCSFEILGEGHNANHGALCIFRVCVCESSSNSVLVSGSDEKNMCVCLRVIDCSERNKV